MGRSMVVKKHSDNNPVKNTYRRHGFLAQDCGIIIDTGDQLCVRIIIQISVCVYNVISRSAATRDLSRRLNRVQAAVKISPFGRNDMPVNVRCEETETMSSRGTT